ncbi:hypothetical protein HFN72_26395 [Rhizobium laguerreae]|uniref:hypothetical protein n=1 Tax=Rhizobium laguerreae TaxID=1076926 RepID=UPI001C921589|nr:hypothetical protein [Rhizobium laguerreae]MBY3529461.1 hypothetical protein [Rhizobium laguerreae]
MNGGSSAIPVVACSNAISYIRGRRLSYQLSIFGKIATLVVGSIPFKAEDASGSVERLEPGEVVKCTAVKCENAVPQELGAKPNDWSELAEIDGNDLNRTVRAARKHFEKMT